MLALDRGSRVGKHGTDLASDVAADSSISLADELGNQDQILQSVSEGPRPLSRVDRE